MDATPTALFDSYEQDFKHIIRSISDKLEGNGKNQLGGMCCSYLHKTIATSLFLARTTQSRFTQSRA
jgi:effector-binding domain-containing protein